MKYIIMFVFITTVSFSGFFNEKNSKAEATYLENDRLCKLFTKKVEKYQKNMRDDVLAKASLESYKYRAELFCKKAKEAKKLL